MKRLALLFVSLSLLTACNRKFSEADVQKTESDIKAEFEQKGFAVEQVNMVIDSDRHMTGYAKMKKSGGFLSKLEITKNCTATMDESNGKYFWQCK